MLIDIHMYSRAPQEPYRIPGPGGGLESLAYVTVTSALKPQIHQSFADRLPGFVRVVIPNFGQAPTPHVPGLGAIHISQRSQAASPGLSVSQTLPVRLRG